MLLASSGLVGADALFNASVNKSLYEANGHYNGRKPGFLLHPAHTGTGLAMEF
ncbi:MAG: hypothetical protein H7Z75_16895 [Ferruginibacter sp.]|nr:hypothetical protein [Cytophagales bacterium]